MASLFKEDYKDRLDAEDIPFYDPSPYVESCILSFLKSSSPHTTTTNKIMTLFEPTGTGKTTIINNIPKLYSDIYQVIIHPTIGRFIGKSEKLWHQLFGSIVYCLSEFSPTNKTIMIEELLHHREILFITLSKNVREVLGKDCILFLYLDECQTMISHEFLTILYSLSPCSSNVKIILTGTTALGNDKIKDMSEFDSIACPPLPPFTVERVKNVLNHVLHWEELQVHNQTIEQSREIKNKIEQELEGTPKNILYFLQELRKQSNSITIQLLENTLDSAFNIYVMKQKKMLEQLLGIQSFDNESFEKEALFEKLEMIFSFPNEFGLERDVNGILIGNSSNEVIKYFLPFNHSGLVRINRVNIDTISLTIPDKFTLRYIREKTLYFPKEWLWNFNSSYTVGACNVKGCCLEIWIAIMLLNQQSTISANVQRVIKEKKGFKYVKFNSDKRNYSTFEGQFENIDVTEPMMVKYEDNSCVDVIIPFSALDSTNEIVQFNLIVQITKDSINTKAKSFFDSILRLACSKTDEKKRRCYQPFIALFLNVCSLASHEETIRFECVKNQLEENSDLLLVQLNREFFPNLNLLEMTENELLKKWIKNSHSFLNIENIRVENLSDKIISPYGSAKKRRIKEQVKCNISDLDEKELVAFLKEEHLNKRLKISQDNLKIFLQYLEENEFNGESLLALDETSLRSHLKLNTGPILNICCFIKRHKN